MKRRMGKSFYLRLKLIFKSIEGKSDNRVNLVGKWYISMKFGQNPEVFYDIYSSQFEFVSSRHTLSCASCGTREGPIQDFLEMPKDGTACWNS